MRKALVFTMLFLVATVLSTQVWAQTESKANVPVNQALSAEDAEKAQEELRKLARAFEIPQPTPVAQTQQRQEPQTMAQITDKALDMVNNAVSSIAATVEKAAPHVWRIMIRQQYAKAFGNLMVPWGSTILMLIVLGAFHKMCPMDEEIREMPYIEDVNFSFTGRAWYGFIRTGLPGTACVLFALWGLNRLADSIMYLVNPEYYAVRDLIIMLLGQTHGT